MKLPIPLQFVLAAGAAALACGGAPGARPPAAAEDPPIAVAGDDSPSGIFDPSVVVSGARSWLAYSSVNYHLDREGHRVQDVGLRIARSDDAGATWTFVRTVVAPSDATISDPSGRTCGAATCRGRWVYETSFLVDDPTAAPSERFRLYASQYFLYPPHATVPGESATKYHLGAIVVWTASSPDRLGAAPPRTALRWTLTPASFAGGVHVNALSPALAPCLAVAEGGASVRGGAMDVVLACTYAGADPLPQKIVLLRSRDHGRTFAYVSTLLEAADAAGLGGASHFTAPALLAGPDPAPVLIVTPSFGGLYGGCAVIPFGDPDAGTLRRAGAGPAVIRFDPPAPGTLGGACAAARGRPLLRSQLSGVDRWPFTFRIVRGAPL